MMLIQKSSKISLKPVFEHCFGLQCFDISKLFHWISLKGDANGIEDWLKKYYSNITNDQEIDASQWAAKNGKWKLLIHKYKFYKIAANYIYLNEIIKF